MATKKICDICGKECSNSGRYELTYKCILRTCNVDICYECVETIKEDIKKGRK